MFQTIVEQIKTWLRENAERRESGQYDNTRGFFIGFPSIMLALWCIGVLFADLFTFDPTYAVNYPKIAAFFGLVYLAGKDYLLAEKEIEQKRKKE